MLTVVPSVDVEAAHGRSPFEQLILGQLDNGKECGVYRIADILNRYGVQGTFFVDVYEYCLWGEDKFRALLNGLLDASMDVQLHTHPSWRWDDRDTRKLNDYKAKRSFYPSDKDLMAKLSLSEQTEIISHGVEKMLEWTGVEPVIHRSGGYSVNEDTISALAAVGLDFDSSVNAASPNTLITAPQNAPYRIGAIVEFPLTTAKLRSPLSRLPGVDLGEIKTELKNYTLKMLIAYAEESIALGSKYMSLFMHSYDLMIFSKGWHSAEENKFAIEILEDFLGWCNDHEGIQVRSYVELISDPALAAILREGKAAPPIISVPSNRIFSAGLRRMKKIVSSPQLSMSVSRKRHQLDAD